MDRTFVEAVRQGTHPVRINREIGHVVLVPKGDGSWEQFGEADPPELGKGLDVATLASFAMYLNENPDGVLPTTGKIKVTIPDEEQVVAFAPRDQWGRHEILLRASRPTSGRFNQQQDGPFKFGHYYPLEAFLVALTTQFDQEQGDVRTVRTMLAKVNISDMADYADDTFTQEVTCRTGVAKMERALVPNPITLAPFRSFREIAQVPSPFLLRLRSNQQKPEVALFAADGGEWKLTTRLRIAEYLRTEMTAELASRVAILT